VAPQEVFDQMPADLKAKTKVMKNGETATVAGVPIEAVAMYNTTPDRTQYHPKGGGNGYLLTIGGKHIYIAGDTEETPEMDALKDIDVAFLPMNLPFTMDVAHAAKAVKDFRPKVVYPYHYKGSDVAKFKALVGNAADVRLLKWY
jgi:L-ascorbate metabolism protein UlaG (beta-lactamase superfamily)